MKKVWIICIGLMAGGFSGWAQNPVRWTFSEKSIGRNAYEVRLTATIEQGWHIYAQVQPEDAIAVPTSIHFQENPLVQLEGKVIEEGNLEYHNDPSLGIGQNEYLGKVEFVQIIKVKGNIKTDIQGTIQFQVCTEHECLPPAVTHFDIPLKG